MKLGIRITLENLVARYGKKEGKWIDAHIVILGRNGDLCAEVLSQDKY